MSDIKTSFVSQLDVVLKKYEEVRSEAEKQAMQTETASNFVTSALAVIDRVAGSDSVYAKNARAHVREYMLDGIKYLKGSNVMLLGGVVSALRDDVAGDFLTTAQELIHAELFNNFLEMADYLSKEGYKDAAAVIAGGVLETHLHQLCVKSKIDTKLPTGNNKKADRLNNDLAGRNIYNVLIQKKITAWLDLRNQAAHAHYAEYTHQDVVALLDGIRDFISRYPA